jgi:threonine dehydrogenase-like Zn-dependent dehydrogenase
MTKQMQAALFVEPGRIVLDDKPVPDIGPLDALVKITTTTICGTDIHILKGEYPVARGLTVGHEPVGVIARLGSAVQGHREGQRVIAGAITPSGWRFGNTIDGCQAEYLRVPEAPASASATRWRCSRRARSVTHRFQLDAIEQAHDLFGNQRDGVLKVAITP